MSSEPATLPPTAAAATVRLTFAPDPALLGTIRLVVATIARNAGVDDGAVEDLKVAVSESCAVAVAGMQRAGSSDLIELALRLEPLRLGVEVRDHAAVGEIPPPGGGSPDVQAAEREFGLALVSSLVDGLRTESLPGGGTMTVFWLPRDPGGAQDVLAGAGS